MRQPDDEYNVYALFKPQYTWDIQLNNINVQMVDPVPSKVQRWLMQKCFNVKITVYILEERKKKGQSWN